MWSVLRPAQELQEPLEIESEDTTPLEAASKHSSEDRHCEQYSVCDSDL
jgi:hypothetical protein